MNFGARVYPADVQKRKLDFRTLDEILAEVDRLQQNDYDMAGHWNLTQNCDHIGKIMLHTLEGDPSRVKIPWYIRMGGKMGFIMMSKMRTIPLQLEAPGAFRPTQPNEQEDEPAVIDAFRQTVKRLRDHNGPLVDHPAFGKLTKDEWIDFHCVHAAHHLSHLVPRA
jgi:hypothetical protein